MENSSAPNESLNKEHREVSVFITSDDADYFSLSSQRFVIGRSFVKSL